MKYHNYFKGLKTVANRMEKGLIVRMAKRHSDLRHDSTFTLLYIF